MPWLRARLNSGVVRVETHGNAPLLASARRLWTIVGTPSAAKNGGGGGVAGPPFKKSNNPISCPLKNQRNARIRGALFKSRRSNRQARPFWRSNPAPKTLTLLAH